MSASSTEKILGKSKKKKSKKGLIIGISIAAAAAALLLITYGLNVVPGKLIRDKLSPAADTADETAYMPVTATAVVMDVQQKLTVTGKVISNAEQIEKTTGYIVDQVNVKVGDTVKAGDVLYTIDMTKTENDITLNQKKLALQQQQNAIDENTASRQYDEAAQSTYNSYLKQSRLNEDAQEDTALAVQGTDYTAEQIEEVRQKMEDAYNAWQSAKTKAEASKASVDQQNLIIAQNEANDPVGYETSSQKAEDDAQLAVLTAQNTQNEEAETKAKDDYDTLKQEYSSFTTDTARERCGRGGHAV